MKKLITFLKKGLAVLLVVLLVSRPVESAHAVITEATLAALGLVVSIVSVAQGYGESASVQERQEIKDLVHDCFVSKADVSGVTVTDGEHLHEMYLELCNLGFPCEIDQVYVDNSWYYCIVGTDYVHIPNSFFGLFPDWIPLHNRVFTSINGIAYAANYKPTSNNYLQWIWEDFGSAFQSVNAHLGAIEDRLLRFYDFITGYRDSAGNTPGTNLYGKMNEIITAIEGISGSAANFDTTPITDKLEEVITSADENFTTAIESINSNGARLDTLIEEVRKISTYDTRYEVETIIPGVFGDYDEIILRCGWEQVDRLEFVYHDSFSYDDPSIYWESFNDITIDSICPDIFNAPYGSYTWAYDLDYENLVVKFSWGENLEFSNGHEPFEAVVYSHSGDYDYTYLSSDGGSFYVPAKDFNKLVISIADDGLYYYDMIGPWSPVLYVSLGQFNSYGAEEFNVTVDGRYGQYFFYEDLFGLVQSGSCLYYDEKQSKWKIDTPDGSLYDVSFSDELTALFTPPDRTVVTVGGEIFSWFEWFYNNQAAGEPGGLLDVTPIVNKLKDIENALSNMGSNIDIENNTNINISEENENYNIFYVDDPDGGEDKSIVDLSGDTLKVFGKLLDFLYKVSFKGALDNAGSGIGDLSDFYLDTSEGSADLWAS